VKHCGDIEAGPVARVNTRHRVSCGFHATWARGEDLFDTV